MRAPQDEIGHIDVVLASNSFWIGEERPCILYGLRGVVHLSLEVRPPLSPADFTRLAC